MIINASDMQGFTLEISDREIYNDIRAECDITEILEIRPDATPEFMDEYTLYQTQTIPPAQQRLFVFRAPSDHRAPHFIGAYMSSLHSPTYDGQAGIVMGTPNFNSTRSEMWVYVHNQWGTPSRPDPHTFTVTVTARYYALDPAKRYIKLRSVDETSIGKYGRRVMDLVWPLGQHPNTMQSILDSYCTRYSEPVCMAQMTLEGSTDAKITTLLALHVDGKHQIIHPRLDMDQNFFINNLYVSFHREGDGILRGVFDLEQVRASEELSIFTLDVSELDGTHVLG